MRFTTTLINSLALAVPLIHLISAEDFCVSGQFRLRIYAKECEGLTVKTKEADDVPMTVCGETWGTEKDGIDGFPIVGDVTIERADIRDSSTKFWLYRGPKDHAFEKKTECTLTFKEDPCVRNLVWKIGQGLDYSGPGQAEPYDLKGGASLRLICNGDVEGL